MAATWSASMESMKAAQSYGNTNANSSPWLSQRHLELLKQIHPDSILMLFDQKGLQLYPKSITNLLFFKLKFTFINVVEKCNLQMKQKSNQAQSWAVLTALIRGPVVVLGHSWDFNSQSLSHK